MTEGQWTQKFVKTLHKRYPTAVVLKLNDAVRGGIPDVVITWPYGRALWLEIKKYPNKLTPLQAHTLKELGDAGVVVTFYESGNGILVTTGETSMLTTFDVFLSRFLDPLSKKEGGHCCGGFFGSHGVLTTSR